MMTLMPQNNKTRRRRDGRLGKVTLEVSTVRSKMKTKDSLYWSRLFQTRRSDIHVG